MLELIEFDKDSSVKVEYVVN